jgi:hypothetical protein
MGWKDFMHLPTSIIPSTLFNVVKGYFKEFPAVHGADDKMARAAHGISRFSQTSTRFSITL